MAVRDNSSASSVTTAKIALFVLLILLAPCTLAAKEDISLQLKWKHAFQFAGYYMALEKGFYDEAGLNVSIIEGGPDQSPIKHVASGEGHYAISDSGIMIAHAKGAKVKVLAAIFQHSPLALAVRKSSGIESFKNLRGKRIMMQRDEMDASIVAALHKAGLSDSDYIRQDTSFNLNDLINGNTDAFSVYTTDQPHQLKERAVRYLILQPIDQDIDFYGDLLFTSVHETKTHPDRVTAFTHASLKGWRYALEHVDETIQLIRSKYNTQNLSLRQLHFEASKTADNILKNEIELGYISEFRWRQIANTYTSLGLIPENYQLTDFIFQPAPSLKETLYFYRWQLVIAGLLFLLLIFAIQSIILRKMVRNRTISLKRNEALQTSIAEVLEMIASGQELTRIFESIIQLFEARYPRMRASILLIQNGELHMGAAPSLPDEYNKAIEGLPIGPMVGSCGSAAYLKKRVIVSDIATDPRWAPYTALTLPHKLLACWSEPIFTSNGEVCGTFGMYYDHICSPTEKELADIFTAAKLAGIAFERDEQIGELRKLSRAIEQAGEVITITNREGIIEYTNPAFTRLTGYKISEAIGKIPRFIRDPSRYKEIQEKLLTNGGWQGKIIEMKKDGSIYPAMLNISPIRDESGEITHYVGVHEDLSEMQKMEERFQQAQKMEAIGTLVGGIAHDFNNMLAGITGNVYLLKQELVNQEKLLEKLERIESLSNHAAEMIKQMLTFASKGSIEKQELSLSSFLKETMRLHRISIPENIEVTLDATDNLYVCADATQLQQTLLNLLTNARDAVKESRNPTIHIKLEPMAAEPSFLKKHDIKKTKLFAHLTVSDNGHGISPAIMQNIFEPFFTTKGVGKGTGLGLSMVFGSIQSHEGVIDVESSAGRGTTFHIYLPLIPSPDEANKESSSSSIPFGKGETILLVDDDEMLIEANSEVIESLGYKVITARNGMEAIQMYKTHPDKIDLIIMDMVMPSLGGKNAAEKIKGINPQAKIIFATGYDLEGSLEFEIPKADESILQKPFSVEVLSQTIRHELRRS